MGIDITLHRAHTDSHWEKGKFSDKEIRGLCFEYGNISLESSVVPNRWIWIAARNLANAAKSLPPDHPDRPRVGRLARFFRRLARDGAFFTCSY